MVDEVNITVKQECIMWLNKTSEGITSRGNFVVIGNWNHDFAAVETSY